LVNLLISLHKMALAFAPGLPWVRSVVWPISSPLRLSLLELELWGDPHVLAWYRFMLAALFALLFVGCAFVGRAPGYNAIMLAGSQLLVVPTVRNLMAPWTWDAARMGMDDNLRVPLAVASLLLLVAYMLLLVPPALQVPNHFWLSPRSWQQTAEDRARGMHLGKLRPGDRSLLNALFSLAVAIILAQVSLLPASYCALQGAISLGIVAAHLVVDGLSPPFEDPSLNLFVEAVHVATVWAFSCALLSCFQSMLGAVLLYVGLPCIAAAAAYLARRPVAPHHGQDPPQKSPLLKAAGRAGP